MLKKSIYLLIALFIGAFIVFQSCNQNNPVTQNESPQQIVGTPEPMAGNGNLIPRNFHESGTGKPIMCTDLTKRIEMWEGVGNPNAGTKVGYLEFTNVTATSMTVTYQALPGYVVSAIHFDIRDSLKKIPVNNNGNPVPGHFKYNISVNPPATSKSFDVILPPIAANTAYFVAAHSEYCGVQGLDAVPSLLPQGMAYICITEKENGCGYWKFDLTGAGALNGTNLCGWCVDAHHEGVPPGQCDSAKLMSSYLYTLDPQCNFNYPQNVPLVNWVLNNFTPGSTVHQYDYQGYFTIPPDPNMWRDQNSTGTVSMADIQYAIWYLLENATGVAGGETSINIWGIVHAAYENGVGFRPVCNQKVAIIVDPKDSYMGCYQPFIFVINVPCGGSGCETAWGDAKLGAQFPGARQWGTYFKWANSWCPSTLK